MDVHQTSSVLDEMPFASTNEDQMVDNVMTMLPIELTNATGTYIQDLNEDCLLEIFSRNSLTPMDLCSLAETCRRFKQITQRLFSKGFDIKCRRYYRCTYTFASKHSVLEECTFQDTERILKNFGPHLSELYMYRDFALVNLVAKYCDDIALNRLKMDSIECIEGVTQQLNLIVQRLLQLSVVRCNLPIDPWNMNCDSLIELEISFCENGAALLRNTFPILRRFVFVARHRKNNSTEALTKFVRRHGFLKSIKIRDQSFDLCKLLRAISCSCSELVELTLRNFRYASVDISHLQRLAKLKVLDIDAPIEHKALCEAIDFSQAFTSLETMEISFKTTRNIEATNQIFDVLSQLQNLCELRLRSCYVNDIPWTRLTQLRKVHLTKGLVEKSCGSHLLDVIGPLINLEELTCGWFLQYKFDYACSMLTEEEFFKIVKLVERRAHVLILRCHFDFVCAENCNEKRKVKLI